MMVRPAVGARVPCGKCGTASTVYGTVFYVEKLVERYFAALREVAALKEAETPTDAATTPTTAASPGPLTGDAFNTDALATAAQHQPLQAWLATRQIQASFDFRAVDTTGFFDEAAKAIGDGYELFAELIERVRSAYRKSFSALNLELGGLSQKDAQAVNNLCRKLHSYTFFSRYVYQKPEKIVRLNLQQAPAVRLFFEGGWLEWYAFIELLTSVMSMIEARSTGTATVCSGRAAATMSTPTATRKATIGAWRRQPGRFGATDGVIRGAAKAAAARRRRPRWDT